MNLITPLQPPRLCLATVDLAADILDLQRLCFREEAEQNGEFDIPPLTQSVEGLREEFRTHTILAAWQGPWLVGSARGRREGALCLVSRVMVHPDHRHHGLGTKLLTAVEAAFPGVDAYELFTGERSLRNLRLYQRLGYAPIRREVVTPRLTLVYLRKRRAPQLEIAPD